MGERHIRRRVLIEDVRRDGHLLRVTWHPERRQYVLSTWHGEVCTGAVQVDVAGGAELASLLVDGLAAAATLPREAGRPPARSGLPGLVDRLRAWIAGAGTGARPAAPGAGAPAPTVRRSA
ncbi:MAG TPA: hypothetical protein VFI47_23830 [Acidimicrobiales bacterium]|nr:hypothetical protein [Acidimicrobiales bacterium]